MSDSATPRFAAPVTPPDRLATALAGPGHAVIDAAGFAAWTGTRLTDLAPLRASWDDLPPDAYLSDGGRYRRRRHASFVVDRRPCRAGAAARALAAGRIQRAARRHRALVRADGRRRSSASPAWQRLLQALAALASSLRGAQPWYVEAHQFRIDTTDGIGRPTPEGAHRDGVDLVAVVLIGRDGIKGGETRVFDADGPTGLRFTCSSRGAACCSTTPRSSTSPRRSSRSRATATATPWW